MHIIICSLVPSCQLHMQRKGTHGSIFGGLSPLKFTIRGARAPVDSLILSNNSNVVTVDPQPLRWSSITASCLQMDGKLHPHPPSPHPLISFASLQCFNIRPLTYAKQLARGCLALIPNCIWYIGYIHEHHLHS